MAQKYYAAADIGGTKVALGLFGEDKTLVGKGQFASDPGLPGEAFFTRWWRSCGPSAGSVRWTPRAWPGWASACRGW